MKTLLFRIIIVPWMCIMVIYCIIMAVIYILFWFVAFEGTIDMLNIRVQKADDYIHSMVKTRKKYIIKVEQLYGGNYFLIYKRQVFGYGFLERWNSRESAEKRIDELNKMI